MKHQDGEFPIKFLGSGDYYWINHGRTFFYEDGDNERIPSMSSSKTMDASFKRGLAEAGELFKELQETRNTREKATVSGMGSKVKGGGKPGQYVKIKTNKPHGNCPVYSVNVDDIQACYCKGDKPCDDDSDCVNRMLMFECHPGVCPVPDQCRNMRFQKRQYPDIQCFRTLTAGWGLKNNEVIKKGGFVIEYVGELITMEEYRARMAVNQLTGEENYYYLTIDAHRMIDAGPKGNLARFMNHSCDPNCIAQKWTVNGDIRVGLFAIKDIQPGSELTFNYQFETVGDNKKQCMCGAANCSGLIGEKPNKEEKKAKEDKNKKLNAKKNNKSKKKKKAHVKSKSPSPAPGLVTLSTSPETASPCADTGSGTKIWEEFCYRCGEEGNLLQCDRNLCPKAYHPLCVGKDAWPVGKWVCPWHVCAAKECQTRDKVRQSLCDNLIFILVTSGDSVVSSLPHCLLSDPR